MPSDCGTRFAAAVGNCLRMWNALDLSPLAMVDDAHDEIITAMCWGRGRCDADLLSASLDRSVRLWRCTSEDCTCRSGADAIESARMERLRRRDASKSGALRRRYPCTLECMIRLQEHDDWIRSICMSPKGDLLVSGSVSGTAVAWDVQSTHVRFRLPAAHASEEANLNNISGLEFAHRSDSIFATGARDGLIKLWDARVLGEHSSQDCVSQIIAHTGKLNNLEWSGNDQSLLSSGRDGAVRVHDLRMLSSRIFDGFCAIAPPPSLNVPRRRQRRSAAASLLQRSYTAGGDSPGSSPMTPSPVSHRPSELRAPESASLLREFRDHICNNYNVRCCFALEDRFIASGSEDGFCYIYDIAAGRLTRVLAGSSEAEEAARDPQSLPSLDPSAVHLVSWNGYTNELYTSILVGASVRVWSPDIFGDMLSKASGAVSQSPMLNTSVELHGSRSNGSAPEMSSHSAPSRWHIRTAGFSAPPRAPESSTVPERVGLTGGLARVHPDRNAAAPLLELMRESGDAIVMLFHKFNNTMSSQADWEALVRAVLSAPAAETAPPGTPGPLATQADRALVARILRVTAELMHAAQPAQPEQGNPA